MHRCMYLLIFLSSFGRVFLFRFCCFVSLWLNTSEWQIASIHSNGIHSSRYQSGELLLFHGWLHSVRNQTNNCLFLVFALFMHQFIYCECTLFSPDVIPAFVCFWAVTSSPRNRPVYFQFSTRDQIQINVNNYQTNNNQSRSGNKRTAENNIVLVSEWVRCVYACCAYDICAFHQINFSIFVVMFVPLVGHRS